MDWKFITLLILFSSPFILGDTEIPTSTPNLDLEEKNVLKEFFAMLLQLPLNTTVNNGGVDGHGSASVPIRPPQYIENLYDRMVLESDDDDERVTILRRRRRNINRSYNFGEAREIVSLSDRAVTIQAIAKEEQVAIRATNERGYLLQFNLEQLWINKKELQLAELVLAVDYTRLIAPPGSYSVYAYTVDDEAQGARLLISTGTLQMVDTFENNFVKLTVTDAVNLKILANGRRSITFEIFVAYQNENTGGRGGGTDLNHRQIENLFHLSNRGAHQPLLVLYSSSTTADGNLQAQQQQQQARRGDEEYSTRRRRNTPSSSITSSSTKPRQSECNQRWHRDCQCRWHEWYVELKELFRDNIVKPEGFWANYCDGKCHFPMYDVGYNATGNALMRSAYNEVIRQRNKKNGTNEISEIPEPACIAKSTAPIMILYYENGNYIVRKLFDMVTLNCQCA